MICCTDAGAREDGDDVLRLFVWDVLHVYTHDTVLAYLVGGGGRTWPHGVVGGEGGR